MRLIHQPLHYPDFAPLPSERASPIIEIKLYILSQLQLRKNLKNPRTENFYAKNSWQSNDSVRSNKLATAEVSENFYRPSFVLLKFLRSFIHPGSKHAQNIKNAQIKTQSL